MNLNESNELIMAMHHKYKIGVKVLEQLWTEAISKQEESAKTRHEKDKGDPRFWKGVRNNFRVLINNLDIQEAKSIMDSRERYKSATSKWLDSLQNDNYAEAAKSFPEIMQAKLDIMIDNDKSKYLQQMADNVAKTTKE
jgi:hypothetical protein